MTTDNRPPEAASRLRAATMWGPGVGEVWWWAIPLATAAIVMAVATFAPAFYETHVLPEHVGYLERLHFLMPAAGAVICFKLLTMEQVRRLTYLRAAIIVFAIACIYIAGEEESWGQHLFQWQTPEAWSQHNRQDETNLHNTSYVFNQLPQLIMEIAIVAGGVIAPFVTRRHGPVGGDLIAFLTPPFAMLPVSLGAIAFKGTDRLQKNSLISEIIARPSEVTETFYYMFILFYLIILYRRVIRL